MYEIYSYGNVDALTGLFNALAALMGGSTFLSAIALVFVVGFFAALVASAMAPDRLLGPKWLMSVIVIYLVLFVPKATVQVVDKVGGTAPGVIDNVPLGLAAQAGIVSSVGNSLTELFETALTVLPGPGALPTELTFANNGLMFGARLVEKSRQVSFTDPALRTDVVNFLQNCTFYDVSQGFIPAAAFSGSTDLWPLLSDTNPARFTGITDPATGLIEPKQCTVAYTLLTPRLVPATTSLLEKLGLELNPALQLAGGTLPATEAATLLANQLPAAYTRGAIADAATDAATIIRQNALINAVRDANMMMSQRSEDPSATLLGVARAQAAAQLNAQQITSGSMMSEAMPLIRNGIEAMLYGLFPFVLLLSMIFGGPQALQMLKSYALGLTWIALWPPIYAVINYLGTLAWAKNAASAAYQGGAADAGLSLLTASPIYSNTVSSMAVMGNMVVSVPVIAAAVVFGLNKIAGVAQSMSAAVGTATGPIANQAAAGNISQGNVSFQQQQLSPNRSSAHMSSFTDYKGRTEIDERAGDIGGMRYTQNIGKNVVSLGSSTEISNRMGEASSKAHAFAEDQSRSADRSTAAAFDRILSNADATSAGTAGSAGFGSREGVQDQSQTQRLRGIRDNLARDLGISDSSDATSVLRLSLGKSGGGREAPDSVAGKIASMIPIAVDGQQKTSNQISASVKRAQAAADEIGVNDTGSFVNDWSRSEDFRRLAGTNQEEANRIAASIGEARSFRESASAAFRQSDEYRQSAELVKNAALSGKLDWTPEFNEFLHRNNALGATGDEALMWANRFFNESGIGIGIDGTPKAVLFEGAGPGNVTVTPGSYRDPAVLEARAANAMLTVGGETASADSVTGWGAGQRERVEAVGVDADATVPRSETRLRQDMADAEAAELARRELHLDEIGRGKVGLDKGFDEAAGKTSIFHHLGDQIDGRSARQQLEKAQEEKRENGAGGGR